LRKFYVEQVDEAPMQRAVRMSDQVWQTTGYPASHIGALYYQAYINGEEDKVIEFFNSMRTGVGCVTLTTKSCSQAHNCNEG
jgi:hypothetical protein